MVSPDVNTEASILRVFQVGRELGNIIRLGDRDQNFLRSHLHVHEASFKARKVDDPDYVRGLQHQDRYIKDSQATTINHWRLN